MFSGPSSALLTLAHMRGKPALMVVAWQELDTVDSLSMEVLKKKSSDNSSGLQYFPIRVSAASLLWIAWGKQRSRPQEIFPKPFPRSGCHPKSRFIFEHFLLRVTSSEYYILTPIGAPCHRSHIEWNGPDVCDWRTDSEPWLQYTR